jgi:hypothetical protein
MRDFLVRLLLLPLGCFGGSPSTPALPAPAPTEQSAAVTQAGDAERRRKRQAASNTILTGPQGVPLQPTTGIKTLLGS